MPPAGQALARFSIRAEADLLALRRIWALRSGRIGPVATGALVALRLDTRDRWFRRAGLTLHILRDARRVWIVLESGHWTTGQAVRRIRLSAPLAGPPARFPGRLPPCRLSAWMSRRLPEGPELIPGERRVLVRTAFPVETPDGVRILVSSDRPESGRARRTRTVELVLANGTPTDLARVCRRVERLSGWTRLADLEPVPAPARAAGGLTRPTLSGRLRRALREQWSRVLAEEPGARAGLDPERIHRMRLAVRRLRSLARLLPPDRRAEEPGLKRLGSLLGRVRDLDIGLSRLAPRSLREPPDPAEDFFRRGLERRRDRAHRDLVRFLDAGPIGNPGNPVPEPRPDADRGLKAPDAQARFERQIRSALRAISRARREGTLRAMHRLRIRGKQTRYILEELAPALGEPARGAALALGELQRTLGEFQDEVAFGVLLDSFARQPGLSPALARWAKARAAAQAELVGRRLRDLRRGLAKTGRLERRLSVLLPRDP